MRLLVTGGAGFIGANFVPATRRDRPGRRGRRARRADLRRQPRQPRRASGTRSSSCRATSPTPRWSTGWSPAATWSCTSPPSRTTTTACTTRRRSCTTNVVGTFTLLEAVRRHGVRLHHISTDEVFGDLELDDPERFSETTPYNPSQPLLRDQGRQRPAGARLGPLVRRAGDDLQLLQQLRPATSTSRSSSRGRSPTCSTAGAPSSTAPGANVRDWIHVDDHNSAVWAILDRGRDRRDVHDRRRRRAVQPRGRRAAAGARRAAARTPTTWCPTGPATTCATPSTAASCAPSSAGRRATRRSGTGWRPPSTWYRDNEDWWRPQKDATERKYAELRPVRARRDDDDPGPAAASSSTCTATSAAGSRRATSARSSRRPACRTWRSCRTTSPTTTQVGVTRGIHAEPWDKYDLARRTAGSSARSSTCATGETFGVRGDLRARARAGAVRPARLRQLVLHARAAHGLQLPGQRALVARRAVRAGQPVRPGAGASPGRCRASR